MMWRCVIHINIRLEFWLRDLCYHDFPRVREHPKIFAPFRKYDLCADSHTLGFLLLLLFFPVFSLRLINFFFLIVRDLKSLMIFLLVLLLLMLALATMTISKSSIQVGGGS